MAIVEIRHREHQLLGMQGFSNNVSTVYRLCCSCGWTTESPLRGVVLRTGQYHISVTDMRGETWLKW